MANFFLSFKVGFEAHCIRHIANGIHDKIQSPDVTHHIIVIKLYLLSIKDDRFNQVTTTAVMAEKPALARKTQNDVNADFGDEQAVPDKQHFVSDITFKDVNKKGS